MEVELTKTHIKKFQMSSIGTGACFKGEIKVYRDLPKKVKIIRVKKFKSIKVGDIVVIRGESYRDYMNTSPIVGIISCNHNSIVFETGSSIYEAILIKKESNEQDD